MKTLVLGGGFGGITVATEVKRNLGAAHEVVLVDRSETFSMGLRKLWELVGHATITDGSRSRDALAEHGIEVVRAEIESIDPESRSAQVGGKRIRADHLVVALGAEPRPDLVPGLTEYGHDLWSTASIPAASEALSELDGGRIVILIAGAPYPCPPAPFECAMLVDEALRTRGVRDRSEIAIASIQPMLMPNAGEAGSLWMGEQLAERGISFEVGLTITSVQDGVVEFEGSTLEFDLLLAVPPHRPADVVRRSGLVGERGWVDVDATSLRTRYKDVFALGDVTLIPLANGLPLPKAGVIAELEGLHVADAITAAAVRREEESTFDGVASCFIEMGSELAGRMDAEFYAEPGPRMAMAEPSSENAAAKRAFERERLERWFGG